MLCILTETGKSPRGDDQGCGLRYVLHRFSAMGMIAVALLVASGIANSAFRLQSFGALVTTAYGLLISAKIALLSMMIALAVINRFLLMPALCGTGLTAERPRAALVRNVIAEQILGVLVLGAAAILGTLSPFG